MRVDLYEDTSGLWRWRLRARNGKIVADGAEGYSTRRKAVDALKRLLAWVRLGEAENALQAVMTRNGR